MPSTQASNPNFGFYFKVIVLPGKEVKVVEARISLLLISGSSETIGSFSKDDDDDDEKVNDIEKY